MAEPITEATADEIKTLDGQLQANPPDGQVRLTTVNDALVAEWISGGTPCKLGPTETRPLP